MDEIANKVCGSLPDGWEITLTMENGAAWVELFDDEGHIVDLPERDDRTLEWQINEALVIANGWVPNVKYPSHDGIKDYWTCRIIHWRMISC